MGIKFYLIKWREGDSESWYNGPHHAIAGSVNTIEEAEQWAAGIYRELAKEGRIQGREPYVIKGEEIHFDFNQTITARVRR